jgi:SAM-dependent methyltransferase
MPPFGDDSQRRLPAMPGCDCPGHENVFSDRMADDDLQRYLRDGPDRPIRVLTEAIRAEGIEAATVLDIGGGVGAMQFELLAAGAASADSVDASPAFVAVARREAGRRGLADRIVHRQGDFVVLAPDVPAADIVTLVRSVCCYDAMPALVGRAAEHARRMVGIVYPRDAWWTRLGARVMNVVFHFARDGFRIHVQSEPAMDRIIRDAGFERRHLSRGLLWQVALYVRPGVAAAQP